LPEGTIAAIHFAPQSAAPLTDVPFEQMEVYYRAYRHFSELVDSPEMQISVTLKEGEALVIENTRILRGTTDSHTAQRTFADRNSLLASLTALETTP
jgi:gamma-butyrobetaine dioxygenase